MITLTERDVQRNMRAVAHAIGQQELEGSASWRLCCRPSSCRTGRD